MPVVRPQQLRVAVITIVGILLLYMFANFNGQHEETKVTWHLPTVLLPTPKGFTTPEIEDNPSPSLILASSSTSTVAPATPSPDNKATEELVPEVVKGVDTTSTESTLPPLPTLDHLVPWHPLKTPPLSPDECIGYERLQSEKQGPLSNGSRKFPYSRPQAKCRTYTSKPLEKLLERMKGVIKDPDLYRLFENSYPNTLDTTIKWRGFAEKLDPVTQTLNATDEELAFVITGDINAMWLRDSASQIYSYLPLLEASEDPDSLASLWRGVINIQARYIVISPYCHSFQPPTESKITPQVSGQNLSLLSLDTKKAPHRPMEHIITTTPSRATIQF